ncbi:hypothetical protein [Thermococcus piezophilus]|nr:hypothetical protein [Thermococcus piezophilus]
MASMDIYGLPNDAIILACGGDGIILIDSKEKLGEIIGSGGSK